MVLEGRRIASGANRERKVRTPKGAMPRNPGLFGWDTRGRKVETPSDGKCHRKSNRRRRKPAVRVKRCGKSAPREAQATRHGKPHRVQGQIGNPGAARSRFRESETDSGYRLPRQMILSPRKRADRIRLTALPKPFFPADPGEHSGLKSIRPHQDFPAAGGPFPSTAGKLKFPVRSTALTATISGRALKNVRDTSPAGRISVVQTSLIRNCRTHSHTDSPPEVVH
jgi:hypothetical protein